MPRSRKPKNVTSIQTRRRGHKRVRGFFAFAETFPYRSPHNVIGQHTPDSCVAACCRMILFDHFPQYREDYRYSESSFRTELETDEDGAVIRKIPDLLRAYGLPMRFGFEPTLTANDLQQAWQRGTVIAIVRKTPLDDAHAVLLDKILEDEVCIRDPLPQGLGSTYAVRLDVFLSVWQNPQTGKGKAVVMLQ